MAKPTSFKLSLSLPIHEDSRVTSLLQQCIQHIASHLDSFESSSLRQLPSDLTTRILQLLVDTKNLNDLALKKLISSQLDIIRLANCWNTIRDSSISEVANTCSTSLRELDLSQCPLVTNSSFLEVAQKCT